MFFVPSCPFPGVWLPREMHVHAGVTLASGSFEVAYERTFSQYRLAEVKTRIGRPEAPRAPEIPRTPKAPGAPDVPRVPEGPDVQIPDAGRGPFVGAADVRARQEIIREIRVHGNAFLTDEEVLAVAGVSVGQALAETGLDEITGRLKDSRLFDAIEVRKRYRSLTATTDIALVLVVHERPGVRSGTSEGRPGIPQPVATTAGRLRSTLMFLPIVSYADGYGFTCGGRASAVDLFGSPSGVTRREDTKARRGSIRVS